jgi:hypothetical protein
MFYINGIKWKVEFTNSHNPILNNHLGMCDNETKTIYLANDLERYMLKKVLCHEIVHAAMFSYNISLSYEQEEIIADLIATYGKEIIDITNKVFKKLQSI